MVSSFVGLACLTSSSPRQVRKLIAGPGFRTKGGSPQDDDVDQRATVHREPVPAARGSDQPSVWESVMA